MIQLHTYPIKNTRMVSSMRATLNSKYCMRAQLKARNLVNGQANEQSNSEYFSYQEGQHRVVSNSPKRVNANRKLHKSTSEV